jgi:hypothetical protein
MLLSTAWLVFIDKRRAFTLVRRSRYAVPAIVLLWLAQDDVDLGQELQGERHKGGQGQADAGRYHLQPEVRLRTACYQLQ